MQRPHVWPVLLFHLPIRKRHVHSTGNHPNPEQSRSATTAGLGNNNLRSHTRRAEHRTELHLQPRHMILLLFLPTA